MKQTVPKVVVLQKGTIQQQIKQTVPMVVVLQKGTMYMYNKN